MLAGSTTAASTISTDTSPVHSPPSARPPRRRGLSYLRNYTSSHFGLDPSRTHTPTPDIGTEDRPTRRDRRSRTTPAPRATTDVAPDLVQNLDSFLGLSIRNSDSDLRMSRRGAHTTGTDGAGVSVLNEFTSRIPIPVLPSSGLDTDSARQALLARNEWNGPAPSIQFIPAVDVHRSNRPSLDFRRTTRVLPNVSSVIKVGRYSERDNTHDPTPNGPSDAPIGFKSKVVSRKHCEFFFQNGQWYIKDVKSSSGTFLNHIRLSQPGAESKPFPINDGDIVQLGIDFKGGEEMIFRCVKMRIETNRGWQRGLNKFNKSTYKQLQRLAKGRKEAVDNDAASKHSTECTICLNSIAPCQALFVAPCSHTWHYKCIKTILESSKYPSFLCPNCRAQADLDAEVEEEDLEDFEAYDEAEDGFEVFLNDSSREQALGRLANVDASQPPVPGGAESRHVTSPVSAPETELPSMLTSDDLAFPLPLLRESVRQSNAHLASLDDTIAALPTRPRPNTSSPSIPHDALSNGIRSLNPSASAFSPSPSASSEPIPIPSPRAMSLDAVPTETNALSRERSDTMNSNDETVLRGGQLTPNARLPSPITAEPFIREGPMTPRNAAGPFVFDGSGRSDRMTSTEQSEVSGDVNLG